MNIRTALCLAALLLLTTVSATAGPIADTKCPPGDAIFNALPTKLVNVSGIVPLGNLNPKGHTIPTRHAYIYPKMAVPGDPDTAMSVPVFAPSKAEIVAVEYH